MNTTHDPAQIIARQLVAAGHGTTPPTNNPWPVFYNARPDTPDLLICVYDGQASMDGRIHRTGEVVEHPGFNIFVRSVDAPTGRRKAAAIANYLDTICQVQVAIDGITYTIMAVTRTTPVLSLGQEEGRLRVAHTVNATLTVKEN